jgi:hypothetical protein
MATATAHAANVDQAERLLAAAQELITKALIRG